VAAAAVYAGGAWLTGLVRADDLTALARALRGVAQR
jgi:hypothetical protein